jgi:hypothetical protein
LGYDNQSIFVAFVLRTYDGFKLYIDDIEAVKEDDTGIDEHHSFSFKLFPVPVNDILNISCEVPITQITISNAMGKIIYQGYANAIDVSNYLAGTYFVNVETEKGFAAKIFTKQ